MVVAESELKKMSVVYCMFGGENSAGMLALDLVPPAKRLLTRMTMGRAGKTPRLARGLPL